MQWGLPGDAPAMVRLTNSFGIPSFLVWRPSNGNWYVFNYNSAYSAPTPGGLPGDIPLAYNQSPYYGSSDGLAVWRPTSGIVVPALFPSYAPSQIGTPTDVPL
jgi:hypothetical protein